MFFRKKRRQDKGLRRRYAPLADAVFNAPSAGFRENERKLGSCMAQALTRACFRASFFEDKDMDLTTPGLIVLEDYRGIKQVPIYQGIEAFDFLTLEVNQIFLSKGFAPCLVVNWWYTVHPWLCCTPVSLLHRKNNQRVRLAAEFTLDMSSE